MRKLGISSGRDEVSWIMVRHCAVLSSTVLYVAR